MNEISRALAQALLDHHRETCRSHDVAPAAMTDNFVRACTITYGTLCERIGNVIQPHGIGKYLYEVGVWCVHEKRWPPIHALAVNKETHWPGDNYDGSPGGHLITWPTEVRACIAFKDYPKKVES